MLVLLKIQRPTSYTMGGVGWKLTLILFLFSPPSHFKTTMVASSFLRENRGCDTDMCVYFLINMINFRRSDDDEEEEKMRGKVD